jgi:hypothetical protein
MADISHLKIGQNVYDIKDNDARTTANSADNKADQAIIDSSLADTKATNANTKIDGASILGTYTSATETIEISLQLGTVSNNS